MTAKKTATKSIAVKEAVMHIVHKAKRPHSDEPRTDYATRAWNADVAAAAGLRNGMTPAEVHAAIEKVVGPDA